VGSCHILKNGTPVDYLLDAEYLRNRTAGTGRSRVSILSQRDSPTYLGFGIVVSWHNKSSLYLGQCQQIT